MASVSVCSSSSWPNEADDVSQYAFCFSLEGTLSANEVRDVTVNWYNVQYVIILVAGSGFNLCEVELYVTTPPPIGRENGNTFYITRDVRVDDVTVELTNQLSALNAAACAFRCLEAGSTECDGFDFDDVTSACLLKLRVTTESSTEVANGWISARQ